MNRLEGFYRRLASHGPDSALQWLLFGLLLPLGWLYAGIARLRASCYRRGVLRSYRAPVPVVSIGNLAVGGTGKTPLVDHLVKYYLALGKRVAVVSRGYGGSKERAVRVVCAGNGALLAPKECGDEPYLLARRNPRALVLVTPRRAAGIQLAVEQYQAELILLDDGFQHLAVKRDLDIVLLDAKRPLGNGQVLPAGLLRESTAALRRGDLFLLSRSDGSRGAALPVTGPVLHCRHALADQAFDLAGRVQPLSELLGKRGVAFAGIAEPGEFFQALRCKGLRLIATLPLADHCSYGANDLRALATLCEGADYLITTEKDGVKLPATKLPLPCYQMPMALEFFEPGGLEQALDAVIR